MELISARCVSRPLVHIGFHKTASTLLQRALFARPDLGFERLYNDRDHIQADFVKRGPFDSVPDNRAADYRRAAREAAIVGRTLVISHERLSGYPGSGSFDAPLIAHRIRSCFPKARILIFVREQYDLIGSYYLQYITDGGSLSLPRLVAPVQPGMYRKPQFVLDTFSFVKTINYYRTLFGPANVLVIPYEALHADAWGVARTIAEYAGQDPARIPPDVFDLRPNAGMPIVMQMFLRQLNGLVNRNQLAPHAPVKFGPFNRWYRRLQPAFEFTRIIDEPFRRRLERQVRELVGDRFVQTNRELQTLTDYDLDLLGYSMSDEPLATPTRRQPIQVAGVSRSLVASRYASIPLLCCGLDLHQSAPLSGHAGPLPAARCSLLEGPSGIQGV